MRLRPDKSFADPFYALAGEIRPVCMKDRLWFRADVRTSAINATHPMNSHLQVVGRLSARSLGIVDVIHDHRLDGAGRMFAG